MGILVFLLIEDFPLFQMVEFLRKFLLVVLNINLFLGLVAFFSKD